jgi:hypothetical protein
MTTACQQAFAGFTETLQLTNQVLGEAWKARWVSEASSLKADDQLIRADDQPPQHSAMGTSAPPVR